jgi:TonB-dependent receptor
MAQEAATAVQTPARESGVVTGRVVDASSGKGLSNVSVSLAETGEYTITDQNGRFRFEGVPSGLHALTFYKGGYEYSSVEELEVRAGEVARLDMSLSARMEDPEALDELGDIVMLDAIVVVAEQTMDNQYGLQELREKAITVSDAIGADDFSRQGIGDAAEAMSRVTGASVMDGKYVLIRGLGDRYANTLMNGVAMPSADPDKRAVQMDQFPTDLLESIQTSKSFTPDQPGDFSGGSVNVRTKSFPDAFFMSYSASTTWNSATTGKDILATVEGLDFWGMDASSRRAPATPEGLVIPQVAYNQARYGISLEPAEILSEFSLGFQKSMFPKTKSAAPNYGFSVSTGDQIALWEGAKFGYTASFTYDRQNSHFDDGLLAKYNETNSLNFLYSTDSADYIFADRLEGVDLPWGDTHWGYTKSTQSVTWGSFAKLALQTSQNSEFTLDLYHNQYAEDEVRRGVGAQPENYPTMIYESYSMLYTERGLTSAQLRGKHTLAGLGDTRVEWGASWSRSTQDQPDYRILQTLFDLDSGTYSTNTTFPPSRFFRELEEESKGGNLDITVPVRLFGELESSLKFGGLYSNTDRTYDESQYSVYYKRGGTAMTSWDMERTIYSPGTIGIMSIEDRTGGGWTVDFGWTTFPTDNYVSNYVGEQETAGAYAMADLLVSEKVRFVTGFRAEHTGMDVTTFDSEGGIIDASSISQTDVLPAASLIYTIRERMNLRFAYGRTIARPTFKELTASRLYDPFRREYYQGNPDLVLTTIDNFDLRWEWFMDKGQMLAFSVFDKELSDPIEVMFKDSTDGTTTGMSIISPVNRESARVTGLEGEWRVELSSLTPWLENFTFGINAALIDSSVKGGSYNGSPIPELPLVGQSPYMVNLTLCYQDLEAGTTVTLLANRVGERLIAFTPPGDGMPDIYENPPVTLDLVASQRLGGGLKLKVSISNILNSPYESTMGKGSDVLIERYRTGRSIGLSLSYTY